MLALVAAPARSGGLEHREVAEPEPAPHEALVAVEAVSLNRGEVRMMRGASDGSQAGWDLAGTVVVPAADGSGPHEGARVVGLSAGRAWAERCALPTGFVAPIPDSLTTSAASTLPVAGLTALHTLYTGGLTDGKRVLVTGAAGGVGRFAVQIANHSGAEVTAIVGSDARGAGLPEIGAHHVVVGMPSDGEYDVILESVGGASLERALALVAPGGTVVTFGCSSGESTSFDVQSFYRRHGARLVGFTLIPELMQTGSAVHDLVNLADQLATGHLESRVELECDWSDAATAFDALLDRRISGKAVLRVAS